MFSWIKPVRALALCAAIAPVSANAVLVNGDFSAGLTGWTSLTDNGTVTTVGGEGILETGTGTSLFSAELVQGDDGSFGFATALSLPADIVALEFDATFTDLGAEAEDAAPGLFVDALDVSVFDSLDFSLDLIFTDVLTALSPGPDSISLNVSSLAGRDVAVFFTLRDEIDNRNSRVAIDNVQFVAAVPAPAPGTVVLLTAGLLGFGVARRNRV